MKVIHGLIGCALAVAAMPSMGQPRAAQPAEAIQPDEQAELQWAASVVKFTELRRQPGSDVKLFGTAGGDPAMNGLQTYVAFYLSPADGYRIFRIGNFLNYEVTAESPGRLALSIRESSYDERTGQIGTRVRAVNVSWQIPRREEAPTTIRVSPLPSR